MICARGDKPPDIRAVDELARLRRFGALEFSALKTSEILDSSAAQIAACAYFAGAWQALASAGERQSPDAGEGLSRFLAERFRLSEDNAAGLLDAVERLGRRYCYIHDAHRLGWRNARAWCAQEAGVEARLAPYLRRHAHLTLSDLGLAGVMTPAEAVAAAAARPARRTACRRERGRRRLAWAFILLLLSLAAATWYWWPLAAVEMPW